MNLEEIRARHHPEPTLIDCTVMACGYCYKEWPCDTARLLDRLTVPHLRLALDRFWYGGEADSEALLTSADEATAFLDALTYGAAADALNEAVGGTK